MLKGWKDMAIMQYEEVRKKPHVLRAMTGLTRDEFEILLLHFAKEWRRRHPQDPKGRGRPPTIASNKDRLLFILYYYKCYPLQEILGYQFNISQERACECIKEFTDILQVALREGGYAPERISENLKKKARR